MLKYRKKIELLFSKYSFIFISFGGLTLIWILNLILVPENPGFLGAPLNPYLFLVIIVAALEGFWPSLFCVALVSLNYGFCVFLKLNQQQEELTRIFQFSYFSPFISFLITGIIIGLITNQQKNKINKLSEQVSEMQQHIDNLHEELTILQEKNVYLKKKCYTEREFLSMLYQTAREMANLSLTNFLQSLTNLFHEVLDANKIAIFMLQGEKLIYTAGFGYQEKVLPTPQLNLLKKAMAEKKVICQQDINLQQNKTAPFLFLSSPLFLGEKGEVIGVVWIEEIPFLHYTPLSLRLVTLLCDWASLNLANIYAFEALQKSNQVKTTDLNFVKVYEIMKRKYKGLFPFASDYTQIETEIKKRLSL